MGFRFRKSINLGGGFRINLSKSGVGYSWGTKGLRYTKTARGRNRTTTSLPGTGLSFVQDFGGKSRMKSVRGKASNGQVVKNLNNSYDTLEIKNDVTSDMASEGLEDMLKSASKSKKLYVGSVIGLLVTFIIGTAYPVMFLAFLLFIFFQMYILIKGTVHLEYSIDESELMNIKEQMAAIHKISESNKVWRVHKTNKTIDKKYSSGADKTVERKKCKVSKNAPFPFKANIPIVSIEGGKETLLFLPDKLIVIQGYKIGALNYSDISMNFYLTRFVESGNVPKDSKVVDYTWEYINKSGEPDLRYKDNRQLPICMYGELDLSSSKGLNTIILYSNPY